MSRISEIMLERKCSYLEAKKLSECEEQGSFAGATGCASVPPPKRRYEMVLKLGSDTIEGLESALTEIQDRVRDGSTNVVSGGCSEGWNFVITETPEMTHELYVTQLKDYLAAKRHNTQ